MHRIEPPNSFLGRDSDFHNDPVKPEWIYAKDTTLAKLPVAPLSAVEPVAPRLPRKWVAAIATSIVLHVAIAGWFLMSGFDQEALTQGGQEIVAVQLGDGDVDATISGAAGDFEATTVTIIPITAPKQVETAEARPAETVDPLEPVEEDAVQSVEEQAILPVTADTVAEAPTEPAQPIPATEAPRILATDVPEVVEDIETVQKMEEVEAKEPVPVAVEKPSQQDVDRKRQEANAAAARKQRQAESEKRRAEQAQERKKQAAVDRKKAEDARAKRAAQAAERRTKQAKAAGENGASKTNARKGRADGSDKATSGANKGKSKANAAGNAAVSNYPGKVRSRIARAAGKIPRSLRSKAKGDVVVSFTVTASGGLGGVSITRSSGLPALDSAAIAAVRRAAPFPAIPDGAGRSSWQFTIPMGLGR